MKSDNGERKLNQERTAKLSIEWVNTNTVREDRARLSALENPENQESVMLHNCHCLRRRSVNPSLSWCKNCPYSQNWGTNSPLERWATRNSCGFLKRKIYYKSRHSITTQLIKSTSGRGSENVIEAFNLLMSQLYPRIGLPILNTWILSNAVVGQSST